MRNSATTRGALHLTQLAAPLRACVAVAAVLLLAGCSSAVAEREAPPSSPASPQTQEPTPTPPTSTATYQPESRYGLTCGAVVDSKLVAEAFTVAVSAVDPLVTASGIGISIPRMTSILSLGGTVCEWSNGVAMNSQYGDAPSYVGLMFSITPPPDSGWSSFAAGHRMPGTWRT